MSRLSRLQRDRQDPPGSRGRGRRGAGHRRQSLLGACRGPRRARAGRARPGATSRPWSAPGLRMSPSSAAAPKPTRWRSRARSPPACGRLLVGATEHDGVMETALASGRPVESGRWTADGVADLDWLADAARGVDRDGGAGLRGLMLANNETGVIQPVAEAAALVHAPAGGCTSMRSRRPARSRSTSRRSAPIRCRSRRTSSADRRASARSDRRPARRRLAPASTAAGRSEADAPAPRTSPGIAGFGAAAGRAAASFDHAAVQAAWRDAAQGRIDRRSQA